MSDIEKKGSLTPPHINQPRDSMADDQTVVESEAASRTPIEEEQDEVVIPGEIAEKDPNKGVYLVKYDGPNDIRNPKTWSAARKWYITAVAGLLVLNATFASTAPTGVLPALIKQFDMSRTLGTLTISLFVAGYCVGPLVWGPLSEQFGRKPIILVAFFVYTAFQVGNALATSTAQVLIFRFIGGMFAASPLTTSGGIIADVWDAGERGKALAFFTLAPFAGPAIGPIVGGYIETAGVSWRWIFWIMAIFAGVCFFLVLFTLPETFTPVIHSRIAKEKRKTTGDDRWKSELEMNDVNLKERLENVLGRPFKVLFHEPMLIAITLYMSFIYGCIYLLFEAYPIVFAIGHGLNQGESGLVFLPLFSGGVIGVIIYILYFNPRYEKLIPQHSPRMVPPEQRLIPAFYGAPMLVMTFLWFGWTSYPSISIWAPMMSGVPLGVAFVFIFLSLFNYIIDAYLMVAASALASSTVVRSAFGAGFPLFSTQMYEKLNPRWASTLLAGISLLMLPIPFVLFKYGPKIRRTSKFAPTFD